ncbi:MAG: glycosyltransferase family 2 protein [Actinomycetota bacterium]
MPELSVVVVAYDMARELPRTLCSLAPRRQQGIPASSYEIIVVDNGSPDELRPPPPDELGMPLRLHRIDVAAASPAAAANIGVGLASGAVIGLIVDGARMASPGLLATALTASRVSPRAVITAPAWHLGPGLQIDAAANGYDEAAEDALLDGCGWEEDGYELFAVSTPAASSHRGLFGPMGESSSLFMSHGLWEELGGLDERFTLPGGGLVNHDLYRRACALPESQLVVLLGEGTFHQIHGGAATSGRVTRDEMRTEYEAIRGEPHRPPSNRPVYVGSAPPQYMPYIASSLELTGVERQR